MYRRRFEKEDNEADYEKACQRIRESTKYALLLHVCMDVLILISLCGNLTQTRGAAAAFRHRAGSAGEDPALLSDLPLQVLLQCRQGSGNMTYLA